MTNYELDSFDQLHCVQLERVYCKREMASEMLADIFYETLADRPNVE